MTEPRTSSIERATNVVGLIAAVTAALTWFVGDVPRIARLALAAVAGAFIIYRRAPGMRRYRLLYASTPILLFLTLTVLPASRSWLLEARNEPQAALRGPALAIEDVQPSWDSKSDPSAAERFRVSILVRNRADEPVVVNRALLGYHQGGGNVGGEAEDVWLKDEILTLHESESERLLEIRQSDEDDGEFEVPVVAFATWVVAGIWDQVIELRPQATIPANSIHTLRVTMPLKLRLAVIKKQTAGAGAKLERFDDRRMDFFVRFDQPQFRDFARLLTVTINTTDGRCATNTTVLERGKKGSPLRDVALLGSRPIEFENLCKWSPPRPPT
jgi:hypothetical protein